MSPREQLATAERTLCGAGDYTPTARAAVAIAWTLLAAATHWIERNEEQG